MVKETRPGQPSALIADFSKPDNPISLDPVEPLQPSDKESWNSGGTAHILPAERKRASFDVETMTNILDGGAKNTARRRFIESPTEDRDMSDKVFWDHSELVRQHVRHFLEIHQDFWHNFKPTQEDVTYMRKAMKIKGSVGGHYGLFLSAIESRGSDRQVKEFFIRGRKMGLVGSYAQTELGHGSNVRGLQTTAVYDKETGEFVMNTPTLNAMKWWPGGIGKVCTHGVIYAQLIIDGKECGIHEFIAQVRDENHRPLPGVILGDLGPKMGDNGNDSGFMRLKNLRIPRDRMLSRYQFVTPDGQYVKRSNKRNDRVHYGTMLLLRSRYIRGSADVLAKGATVATRYSAVRKQGFKKRGNSYKAEEHTILDHQVQKYRILKQLAMTYALQFTGRWMTEQFSGFDDKEKSAKIDVDEAKEFASTTSGLKATTTVMALEGLEDLRKCCGGNGYLLASGIALEVDDFCYQTTAEGDFILLFLQTARYLIRRMRDIRKGARASGPAAYLNVIAEPNFSLESTAPKKAQSKDDVRNIEYLISLYRHRALSSFVEASDEFEGLVAQGQDFQSAFNDCAVTLVEATKYHCIYFIIDLFAHSLKEAEDPSCRLVLEKLSVLCALTQLLDSRWDGLLDRKTVRLARSAAVDLLNELRPDAVALVDAFDFHDNVLSSVLGGYDGNVYEALFESAKRSGLNQVDPFKGYEFLEPVLDKDFLKAGNSARYEDPAISKL